MNDFYEIGFKQYLSLVRQELFCVSPPTDSHVIRLISYSDNEDNGKQSLRRLVQRIHSSVFFMQEDAQTWYDEPPGAALTLQRHSQYSPVKGLFLLNLSHCVHLNMDGL